MIWLAITLIGLIISGCAIDEGSSGGYEKSSDYERPSGYSGHHH